MRSEDQRHTRRLQLRSRGTTKAEQETIIRWDEEEPVALLYTTYHVQARRWDKLGYPVEVCDQDANGNPRGWQCTVPKETVRFRKVSKRAVVKRRTGAGRQFVAIEGTSEEQAVSV